MFDTQKVWKQDLDTIFQLLDASFDIHINATCSMQIHIEPVGGWRADTIRSVARAAAIFDDAITKIMPAARKEAPWARSNFRRITHRVSLPHH